MNMTITTNRKVHRRSALLYSWNIDISKSTYVNIDYFNCGITFSISIVINFVFLRLVKGIKFLNL